MDNNDQKKNNFIRINVGGIIYSTTRSTLCSGENFFTSLFRNIENGMETTTDDQGHIFVDRNGQLFFYVLEYLRNGVLDCQKENMEAIKREFQFFSIPLPTNNIVFPSKSSGEVAAVNSPPVIPVRQWAIIKCTSSLGNTWIVTSTSFSKEYYGINGWIEALNSLSSKGYFLHKFYQHDSLDKQTIWMYKDFPAH